MGPEDARLTQLEMLLMQYYAELEALRDDVWRENAFVKGEEGTDPYSALFDIYDVDSDARTFSIRGHSAYEVAVAGNWENIDTLSGFTADGVNFDASALASGDATHYVFLIVQRTDAGATVTLKVNTTVDALDDDTEIFPLWQLAVADEALSVTMDLRNTKHWVAGA